MSNFDPPLYIGKLISAINDGAKSAQLGAVAFVLIGLFLLATSFSATDEDLLIGKSISISQLGGVTVPVVLSFGFMPAIFLALHLYTLIRFDLLMQNLRHFEAELLVYVPHESDRERCLQLLGSKEFLWAQTRSEANIVFRWSYRFLLALFPIAVLLLVQLSSLRMQDYLVNIIHHIAITLDVTLLIWFFHRQSFSDGSVFGWLLKRRRFVLPAMVLAFDFLWCRVPSADVTTVGTGLRANSFFQALEQPVDLVLCPSTKLGCRFISVPNRTLVERIIDPREFLELRAGRVMDEFRQSSFEPLVLRNRRLRFADLSQSELFGIDLTAADLQSAWLNGAQLQGARLDLAQLQNAWLDGVQLRGATFIRAQLQDAWLRGAQMQGAKLDKALMRGVSLTGAEMQGALLYQADLQEAWLDRSQLQGASLDWAQLQGASLIGARLQGASLQETQLQGASLDEA